MKKKYYTVFVVAGKAGKKFMDINAIIGISVALVLIFIFLRHRNRGRTFPEDATHYPTRCSPMTTKTQPDFIGSVNYETGKIDLTFNGDRTVEDVITLIAKEPERLYQYNQGVDPEHPKRGQLRRDLKTTMIEVYTEGGWYSMGTE